MSSNVLPKLKNKINEEIAQVFSLAELTRFHFVPLDKQNGSLYIVVTDNFFAGNAMPFIESKVQMPVKTIAVSQAEYKDLFSYYTGKYCSQIETITRKEKDESANVSVSSLGNRIGDILLAKNLITKEQLSVAIKNAQMQNKLLGDVLVADGTVSGNQLKEILAEQSAKQSAAPAEGQPKKRVGDLLVEQGLITEEQLQMALQESKTSKEPIGSVLVKLGFIAIEKLKDVLATQQGTEVLASSDLKLDPKLLKSLPEDFIRAHKVLPIRSNGQIFVVGMVDPNNKRVLNDIIYLTGQKVRAMIITHIEFESCLQTYYSKSTSETNEIMRKMKKETSEVEYEESLFEQVERELQDESGIVAKFANKIITDAIDIKASDIHIEPRLTHYVVRYRTDGILREMFQLPERTEQSIITRFKVLSRMNIAEHRRAQDGTFTLKYGGKEFDFRINTLPVAGKEKMVIRILAPAVSLNAADKDIKLVGGTAEDLVKIKKMTATPNGIILATGPTGSGKTTTLYSILKSLNDEKVNITTIEDPVEIKIDGINQSQINAKAGITFASCMRAILRQDPDIILVGEIRDYETLETAIAASLTGHLVLSTVHTNSAAATVSRLIEMGAKEYLVASTLTGIIAQRLVRRLCPLCKVKVLPTEEEARSVILGEEEVQKFMKQDIYKPGGCVKCNFDGYAGRLGVYEILLMNKELKKLIANGVHDIQIEEAAISMGMKTLQQSCLSHIIRGETAISEYIRVLGPVQD